MVRAIFFGPEVDARIAELVAFAEANPYEPERGDPAPGYDPRYCIDLPGVPSGIRCVFTITIVPVGSRISLGKPGRYRHLSMSIPGCPDRLVNHASGAYIASLFGFTGGQEGWLVDVGDDDGVVELAQAIDLTPTN